MRDCHYPLDSELFQDKYNVSVVVKETNKNISSWESSISWFVIVDQPN